MSSPESSHFSPLDGTEIGRLDAVKNPAKKRRVKASKKNLKMPGAIFYSELIHNFYRRKK
jgi:hypothetical protein